MIETIQDLKRKAIEDIRREQILNVALKLFYKNGYTNTKVSDIAEAAGISKGLIYRYFKTKADILFAYREKMNICLDECNSLPTPKDCILAFAYRLLEDPEVTGYLPPLRVYITVFINGELTDEEHRNPIYDDFASNYFEPLFKKGIEQGQFREGNPKEYASIFWHALLGYTIQRIKNPDQEIFVPDPKSLLAIFEK